MKFVEGDVVSRKTGGPLMTVEDLRSDELVAVVWFDAHGHVHRDCFAANTLLKWKQVEDTA